MILFGIISYIYIYIWDVGFCIQMYSSYSLVGTRYILLNMGLGKPVLPTKKEKKNLARKKFLKYRRILSWTVSRLERWWGSDSG